jgi:hypothetical protein
VALDCLAVALPQARDAKLREAFLEDTLRQALADAALPERYIQSVVAPSVWPGGEEALMIGGRVACSASLVERGVVVGMSLLGGGCATLHGAARGLRCVIDMACDALHTRPTTIQVCIACAGQAASAPAVATHGNGQWAMQVVKTHLAVVRFLAVATSTAGAGPGALETGCVCVARMVCGLLAAIDAHVDALTGVVKCPPPWCGVVWCIVCMAMAATRLTHSLIMRCGTRRRGPG